MGEKIDYIKKKKKALDKYLIKRNKKLAVKQSNRIEGLKMTLEEEKLKAKLRKQRQAHQPKQSSSSNLFGGSGGMDMFGSSGGGFDLGFGSTKPKKRRKK